MINYEPSKKEGFKDVILNVWKKGATIEFLADITGLSTKEVEDIVKQNNPTDTTSSKNKKSKISIVTNLILVQDHLYLYNIFYLAFLFISFLQSIGLLFLKYCVQ